MSEGYDYPAGDTHEGYEAQEGGQYETGHELYAQPHELVDLIGKDLNEAAFDLHEPHEGYEHGEKEYEGKEYDGKEEPHYAGAEIGHDEYKDDQYKEDEYKEHEYKEREGQGYVGEKAEYQGEAEYKDGDQYKDEHKGEYAGYGDRH